MEWLPAPLVSRKWVLCIAASLLGYLLLSYSIQRACRPSTSLIGAPQPVSEAVTPPPVSIAGEVRVLASPLPPSVEHTLLPGVEAGVSASRVAVGKGATPWRVSPLIGAPIPVSEAATPPPVSIAGEVRVLASPLPPSVEHTLPPGVEAGISASRVAVASSADALLLAKVAAAAAVEGMVEVETEDEEEEEEEEEKCDLFEGRWVYDRTGHPLYRSHWCPFLSEQVSCRRNGRPDSDYEHWRWQPSGCSLPRFNGSEMLERWRGKRVVIVGDSLNRNMWESLACMLYSATRRKRAYVNVRSSEHKVFRALDYDCTVEFYWSPFLVELQERGRDGAKILRLDKLPDGGRRWAGADVLLFNTGHWWTHHGKMRAWDYFERREQVKAEMEGNEAFNRALRTWASWVDSNVDPRKTTVLFRGISPEHKRENLHWCFNETRPIGNERYVQTYPRSMVALVERTLRRMKTPVTYLNVTRLSEYRRDAHTAVYTSRGGQLLTAEQRNDPARFADCSHWCLPGLPDTWNLLLFASLPR